jgi:hypothetical protein
MICSIVPACLVSCFQTWVMPPSAMRSVPVLKLLSLEAWNNTADAISFGSPMRPRGVMEINRALRTSPCSLVAVSPSIIGVSIGPGVRARRAPPPPRGGRPRGWNWSLPGSLPPSEPAMVWRQLGRARAAHPGSCLVRFAALQPPAANVVGRPPSSCARRSSPVPVIMFILSRSGVNRSYKCLRPTVVQQ